MGIKDFKNVTLYLEGRDLLDQPTETKFESEELQEYWTEVVRRNRSMVILGVKWKFWKILISSSFTGAY